MNDSFRSHALRPSLALVVIARDESRCIERCLASARPFVDRMLVLDTGSRDDTVERAVACGARVEQAAWTGDFSAARNAALELADAHWHLVLDADEWIESGGEALEAMRFSPARLGAVAVHSRYEADARLLTSTAWITRLLPGAVRYAGRIHEQPQSSLPRVRLPLTIGHDGYLGAQREIKRGRNRPLLEQSLAADPGNAYLRYQLGKDCEVYGEYALACEHYVRALAATGPTDAYRSELQVRALHCLGRAGRRSEALTLAGGWLESLRDCPDFFFTLGNLLLDEAAGDPARAIGHWLPMAEQAWLRCLEIGERPDLEGSVAGRGSHLAAHNLAVLCRGLGDTQRAQQFERLSSQGSNAPVDSAVTAGGTPLALA
jgi:hypothetical protein